VKPDGEDVRQLRPEVTRLNEERPILNKALSILSNSGADSQFVSTHRSEFPGPGANS